jgi:hypothetical protein
MKTDFEDLRKWRRAQVTLAIVLIVQGVTGLVELSMGKGDGIFCWMQTVVLLAFAAVSFCVYRCSGCPYCGKSVMSGWNSGDKKSGNSGVLLRDLVRLRNFG